MTQRGKLIGIVGHAGSGKTTVTGAAMVTLNYAEQYESLPQIIRRNFSTPIVEMLAAMGVPRTFLDDKGLWDAPLDVLCGKSVRQASKSLGTEWGRNLIGSNVWANIALNDAEKMLKQGIHVIIDNVRFPSEMDAMRKRGANFIALRRNVSVDITHESEAHIKTLQAMCWFRIDNNGEFEKAAERMRETLLTIIA